MRRPLVGPAACLVVLAALAGCASRDDRFAYSGTVQADSAAVGSMTGGRVTAVLVADGQQVESGQPILRFDDKQQRAAYDLAVAQAAQSSAELADLLAGPRPADVDKAAAAAAQARALYAKARLDRPQHVSAAEQGVQAAQADVAATRATAATAAASYERARTLYAQGAISAQALDEARAAAQSAAGARDAATARLRNAQAQLDAVTNGAAAQDVVAAQQSSAAADAALALVRQGARPDQIAGARAAAQAASAAVAAARARLDETVVVAPARGVVDGLDLRPGDIVAAGAPVTTIDEFGDPWTRIYVAQSDMADVRVGAPVDVRADALGGREFSGRVETIDAAAQFTPRDVQTASDRADLSFGVKVRIHDPDRALRAGTTVVVALPRT